MKKFSVIIVVIIANILLAYSQGDIRENEHYSLKNNAQNFFFDALIFKAEEINQSRLDIYAMIPFQILNFTKTGEIYMADFSLVVSVFDSSGNTVYSETVEDRILDNDYFEVLGGNGSFKIIQKQVFVSEGDYRVKLHLTDNSTKQEYSRSRKFTVPNFNKYPTSLSGIMLVSSIEENNGKYSITPHIDDNIAMLKEGWFLFFEAYNSGADTAVDFEYHIIDENEKVIASNIKNNQLLSSGTSRHYFRVSHPTGLIAGQYVIKVFAKVRNAESENDVIAMTTRSIANRPVFGSYVLENIDAAISQLIYVASSDIIDYIQDAKDDLEKRERFDEFWKSLDPSVGTDRNEAFDEYYLRVAYADDNFGMRGKGWRTDMGEVYIVYGAPYQIDRNTYQPGTNNQYQRWTYTSNRTFQFLDKSGFGDYKLVDPIAVGDRYQFQLP